MVLQDYCCENCGKIYTSIYWTWCEPCQINKLEKNFANWTSGNEKIDEFIQEMQLKIELDSIIVEWIPYNQFDDIKEIGKDGFATVLYSAIWMDGPLKYNICKNELKRIPNKEVTLKCFYTNSQNITNEFLNEV